MAPWLIDLERAVRLELTNTGFAIRRLGRLATRAESLLRIHEDKKH